MSSFKRFMCGALAALTIFNAAPPAFASETSLPPKIFSVTVPVEVPIRMDKDGGVSIPQDLKIQNDSNSAIAITDISVEGKNGWTVVDWSQPTESKAFAMRFRGDGTKSDGSVSLKADWTVREQNFLNINAEAKMAKQEKSTKTDIAVINWAFGWAGAGEEETKPEPPKNPDYNIDDDVTMPDDKTYTITILPGDHGYVEDGRLLKTDRDGIVPKLPNVTTNEGYVFDKWVDESGNEVKAGDVLTEDITITPVFQAQKPEMTFSVEYNNGLMLPESNNTATFKWSNAPSYFELDKVTSSDPSIAEVSEIHNISNESKLVRVKALKRGTTQFTGISTTGEAVSFNVQVSELDPSAEPVGSVNNIDSIEVGGTIEPSDITISIPVVGPSGSTSNITVIPNKVSDNVMTEGENTVLATVDVNGVTINVYITINLTIKQDPNQPTPPPDQTHTITVNLKGEHGHANSGENLTTDKNGTVPALPSVTPDEGYILDKWVDGDGNEVKTGDILDRDVVITPVFRQDNTHTLTPVDGDHCTVNDKTPIKTDTNGIVLNNLPAVMPDPGCKFEKWVDVGSGEEIAPGDVLKKDITIKPVIAEAAERYTISFQTDSYYALDNTMPLTSTNDHRIPMEQMPGVSPNVSHFFDQVWVNADTGEIVDAGTVLTSDITVKPQISCLFEVEGETVKGFSAYAETVDVSNITIPTNIMGQTVNKIGNAAFAGCASSFTTDTMQNATGRESTANNIKNVVLEQGFTEIGIGSFGNMGNLTTISLPEGITAIGQDAFRNTFALESVELPSTAGSLGWGAFRYSAVSDAKLNDGLLSIGDDCFYGCNNLASISIPTSVTSIGKSAFYGASKLTTVNVPNSVKSLGAEAFSGCSSLEDAYIGRGVVYFKGTFQNCGSLKTVVIDGRAETITGSSDTPTFYGCDSLTDIYIRRAEGAISGKYWGCRSKPTIHWVGAW